MAYRFLARLHAIHNSVPRNFRPFHTAAISYKLVKFILSDIGEGIREVTLRDWFVKEGDKVAQFDNICLVESDKASVNITSRYDGTVNKLYYQIGDTALVGDPLLDIETYDSSSDEEDEKSPIVPKTVITEDPGNVVSSAPSIHQFDKQENKALATPSVRRIAKENNVSLNEVNGTGKLGRILKEDILSHLNVLQGQKQPPFVKQDIPVDEGMDKKIPLTGVKRAMVNTMTKAGSIPTFGYSDEINMTRLIEVRNTVKELAKAKGIALTYMPFFIKALSKSLEKYPELNAVVDENCENLIYKTQHNIGFAMDTPSGLIVPNVKDVRNLNILQIALELNRILKSGKDGIVNPSDLTGGTFTISNIGIIGGTYMRPLILPPELGIVAMGKIQNRPLFDKHDNIVKSYIMCVSWAGDHRVIDGATMARFATLWKNYIECPEQLMLDL